jgi:hypothetical protein
MLRIRTDHYRQGHSRFIADYRRSKRKELLKLFAGFYSYWRGRPVRICDYARELRETISGPQPARSARRLALSSKPWSLVYLRLAALAAAPRQGTRPIGGGLHPIKKFSDTMDGSCTSLGECSNA